MSKQPCLMIVEEKERELEFLKDFGYDVSVFSPGNGFLGDIESCETLIDLLIINLPFSFVIGSGFLKVLRGVKDFKYTPIIVVSDSKDKKDQLFALREGADDFVSKPLDVDILLARIDASLRRSRWNKATFVDIAKLPFLKLSGEVSDLTVREKTILSLISQGISNDEIAIKLCLSGLTVKTHVKNLFKKLGVSNRTEAILVAMNFGFLDID